MAELMQFEGVIEYLEKLIGLELESINESNDSITILSVDKDKKRYTVDGTSTTKKRSRAFSELQKIWDELLQKGYVSVEQALNGAGSSRHQPETILANLPCIEFFRYEKKKHLYLRSASTHPLSTLKELSLAESRELKKRIDRYRDFDISLFHSEHAKILGGLHKSLENVFVKYPGESDVESINIALSELEELQKKLAISVVSLESEQELIEDSHSMSGRNYEEDEEDDEYKEFFGQVDENKEATQYLVATRISQVTPTVSLLFDRINHNEINLQPEFQRKDRIWPLKDKSRLIESVLLGLPIPVFYFAEDSSSYNDDTAWIVIDGLQRTTTLYDFIAGNFELKFLERRKDLNGFSFKDLARKEQRRIREYQIQGHLIQVSSDSDEMVRELFQRINTSGKNLSYQEIRSALYPGSAIQFLKYIAGSPDFINATPLNINPERMLDLEYVLRAVSYIYNGYENFSYSKYDDFLCKTLKQLNKYTFVESNINSDNIYKNIEASLVKAFRAVKQVFGEGAYRKEPTGKLNKSLFELKISTFAMMSEEQIAFITQNHNAKIIKDELYRMIKTDSKDYAAWSSTSFEAQDRGFEYSISNSTGKSVTIKYRFDSFINMINAKANINLKFKPFNGHKNDY